MGIIRQKTQVEKGGDENIGIFSWLVPLFNVIFEFVCFQFNQFTSARLAGQIDPRVSFQRLDTH